MKVTVIKTFINDNGFSILKGRKLEVAPEVAKDLEGKGLIESVAPVADKPQKKATKK